MVFLTSSTRYVSWSTVVEYPTVPGPLVFAATDASPPLNPRHEAVHFSCRFSESPSLPASQRHSSHARLSSSGRGSPPSFLPSSSAAKHCSSLPDGDGLTNGETTDEAPFLIYTSATASNAGGGGGRPSAGRTEQRMNEEA